MGLRCPLCTTSMQEVKAEATTGYFIVLDQCPRCGGTWCAGWELYPVSAAAAERIAAVDGATLQRTVALAIGPLDCPRCRARMRRFHDPALAPDAHIERCPNCDGMWLNRGELRAFKKHCAVASPRARLAAAELDRLATRLSPDPKTWPAVS